MCLCGTDVQYSYFVSPDRYQYRLQLSTDSKFCMQLGTPISMPTTRIPFIGRLYFIYQSIGQIISFQMMPPLRSFDDLDGQERGKMKTDDLRAMTTLGPRTLSIIKKKTVLLNLRSISFIWNRSLIFITQYWFYAMKEMDWWPWSRSHYNASPYILAISYNAQTIFRTLTASSRRGGPRTPAPLGPALVFLCFLFSIIVLYPVPSNIDFVPLLPWSKCPPPPSLPWSPKPLVAPLHAIETKQQTRIRMVITVFVIFIWGSFISADMRSEN